LLLLSLGCVALGGWVLVAPDTRVHRD